MAVSYNTLDLAGSMPATYSRSTSSRRAWRKVLQQLAEKLRAEYMEGKAAVAVGTKWTVVEATTAEAAAAETAVASNSRVMESALVHPNQDIDH